MTPEALQHHASLHGHLSRTQAESLLAELSARQASVTKLKAVLQAVLSAAAEDAHGDPLGTFDRLPFARIHGAVLNLVRVALAEVG